MLSWQERAIRTRHATRRGALCGWLLGRPRDNTARCAATVIPTTAARRNSARPAVMDKVKEVPVCTWDSAALSAPRCRAHIHFPLQAPRAKDLGKDSPRATRARAQGSGSRGKDRLRRVLHHRTSRERRKDAATACDHDQVVSAPSWNVVDGDCPHGELLRGMLTVILILE